MNPNTQAALVRRLRSKRAAGSVRVNRRVNHNIAAQRDCQWPLDDRTQF